MVYKFQSIIKRAKRRLSGLAMVLVALAFPATVVLSGGVATAATPPFSLVPFEFVGTTVQCGGPAGIDTVTAKWDTSTGNPAPSILLQKLGATSNCASAGVDIITPLEGQAVSNVTELNFDYKDGGHCGAGAPRFNLQAGVKNAFLGCAGGTHTSLGNGWTHVEFNQAQITAALVTASITSTDNLDDVYIIFDEGSDTGPDFTGTINIDSISVNNAVIGSPTTPQSRNDCKNNGFKNFTDNNGNIFNSQGQCIAFVNRGNRIVRKNINHVTITNNTHQTATTGNASVSGNTTGGNATTGDASNSNTTTNTVNIGN